MLDPITTTIVAKFAGTLFGQVAKPIIAAARDAVFGKPGTRAMEKAIRQAVEQGVEEVCAYGVPVEVVQHVLLMVQKLVEEQPDLGADLLGQQDHDAVVRLWTEAAEAAGWDLATFPVHYPDVVKGVTRHIPEKIRAMAGEAESPLNNRVVLAVLGKMESQLTDLQKLGTAVLSRDVPLADPLRETLEQAKATCQTTNSYFHTPHLLLALIRSPSTGVRALLDQQRAGLAAEIEGPLAIYVGRRGEDFVAFDWRELAAVQAARVAAIRLGSAVVTGRLLFLGVLETPSKTVQQLTAALGDELLAAVKRAVLTSPAVERIPTPGVVYQAPRE
ncbi:hypothetical protein [Kitasatospora cineracea]|uniref:Uncharacterized protein n=1 Tax=Kitasatospora cineracea TaxID=88074 RepID=A0A8G1XAT0_9ACTN|nr:hypothetical protein [Kitasatospora cineracea]ROR38178.1 hypothetical protein EDD39_6352 [Kitasatospora cineracea]